MVFPGSVCELGPSDDRQHSFLVQLNDVWDHADVYRLYVRG